MLCCCQYCSKHTNFNLICINYRYTKLQNICKTFQIIITKQLKSKFNIQVINHDHRSCLFYLLNLPLKISHSYFQLPKLNYLSQKKSNKHTPKEKQKICRQQTLYMGKNKPKTIQQTCIRLI